MESLSRVDGACSPTGGQHDEDDGDSDGDGDDDGDDDGDGDGDGDSVLIPVVKRFLPQQRVLSASADPPSLPL